MVPALALGPALPAARAGNSLEGALYYTSCFDQPRGLLRVDFRHDGQGVATLGHPVRVAELPGLPDGLAQLPEEGLAVGCGSQVAFVNPTTGTVRVVPAGIQDAYHVVVDASGTNVWTGNGLGFAVVPAVPPAPGAPLLFQEDSVVPEEVAWLGAHSVFFAADGLFGTLEPNDPMVPAPRSPMTAPSGDPPPARDAGVRFYRASPFRSP
ncbi:MAG: hypothetical protein J0L84_00770 [Verrucomicrobia bacterium]|nr:hypothetical protein [Verrucomicrobiota bacterium]